jgi:regulator of sigma E protease
MFLTALWFILVLSFLVFVHELGHYLAARHVGVRVQRFSIGFPPRAIGKKVGETEYMLSWIPLGGYVKLEGQNLDDENPRDPRNYAAKTKLQRLYILLAGPAMNLALALLLMPLVFMLGVESPRYRLDPPVLADVQAGSPAAQAGFRAGDRIVRLGTRETPSWNALDQALADQPLSGSLSFRVERPGAVAGTAAAGAAAAEVSVPAAAFASSQPFGWKPLVEPIVGQVAPRSPAQQAGLRSGDRILAVNGAPVRQWDQMPAEIQKSQGAALTLAVRREERTLQLTLAPMKQGGAWVIGISPGSVVERHGVLASFRLGTERVVQITGATFSFLGHLVTGRGSLDSLGGPVKIGVVIGEAARSGLDKLLFLTALISLQLGIFNLLPIPALDGGHIFLIGLEWIARRPLSVKVRERAQIVGFSLLIALILVVTYNDVLQLIS